MQIIVREEDCSGCRACEIACSFHHRNVFTRSVSSIIVDRLIDTGKKRIRILEDGYLAHLSCDLCVDEKEPLCVKYCSTGALTLEDD